MRILVALGGNAITPPDGTARAVDQEVRVRAVAGHIAALVGSGHVVAITHGNGPQVGAVLLKNELAAGTIDPVPLDWCGAQTQGGIGAILLNALDDAFAAAGIAMHTAALISRTLVAADDPAFAHPTKPIGALRTEDNARRMIEKGQSWQPQGADGWRRVVASPEPIDAVDAPAMRALLDAGFLVIGNGGGGVPVVRDGDGALVGVEAVIDKDLSAILLGQQIEAEVLVLATAVENVVLGWGTESAQVINEATVTEMRGWAAEGHFPAGSMGPKVEAACRFVEGGGKRAVITSLDHIVAAVAGDTGTIVTAG